MTLIAYTQFSGIAPKRNPLRLPATFAQTAQNCDLTAGTLKPWNGTLSVLNSLPSASACSIYRFGIGVVSDTQYWFHFSEDTDVVKSAIAGDTTERTYFCNASQGARVTNNTLALTGGSGVYPWNSYPLGVPAPIGAPSVASVGGSGAPETRVYAVSYKSTLGELGPPSPTSAAIDVLPGSTTTITGLGTEAPGGHIGHITAKLIWRTVSGNLATEFQLVDEIPVSQSSYVDSVIQPQEAIQSVTYDPPPAGAFGLCQMANGIMLMFKGYDIYPSEAFLPHAYPTDYIQPVDYPIVGAAAFGSSALICTTGVPYLLSGSSPSSLTLQMLDKPQGCVSKRSIVSLGDGVAYASPDGLVFVSSTGAISVATEGLFSRAAWQDLNPESMHGYLHDGRYIGFFDTGAVQGGFIFDPSAEDAAFTMLNVSAVAGFSDLTQDALFLKVGTEIVKWNAGASPLTFTWKSRIERLPYRQNLSVGQVHALAYPVTFKLIVDGVTKHTQTVADAKPFRMPANYRGLQVEVEVSGTKEITAVYVAQSVAELKQVS